MRLGRPLLLDRLSVEVFEIATCARSSMDRASDFGSAGWGFNSLRAHQRRDLSQQLPCLDTHYGRVERGPGGIEEPKHIFLKRNSMMDWKGRCSISVIRPSLSSLLSAGS